MTSKHNINNINLKNIIYESVLENKQIAFSMCALLSAYWLQDVVFPNTFSKFTSNVPKFISSISFDSVMLIIFPYMIAELGFYINNIIVSSILPKIELSVVQKLTTQAIESVKSTKVVLNTNEFIMNLKKVIESKSLYYLVVSNVLPTILISIGMIYNFSKASIKMGGVTLIIMIILFIITINIERHSVNASYENEDAMNLFYDNIQDVITNADTVITSNSIMKELNNINIEKSDIIDKYARSDVLASEAAYELHMISLLATVFLTGSAIKMNMDGTMPTELLVSICIMSILFMQNYNSTISKFKNAIHYIGKFYEINDYFAGFKLGPISIINNLKITNGDIEFKNVGISYGDKKVINNFNYFIKGNTKIGIIGNVGSGKTSLVKTIAGLIDYTGDIFIDNQNLKLCNYDSIMKYIVYIPQHPKMFNKDILYNISYGTSYKEEDIWKFLDKIHFADFFNGFQKKLKTKVGKEGNKLSGGQKQIISLVRSLLQNKAIILLDEPTSSLDQQTKTAIIDLLKRINGKTVLIVTHDESLINLFDDVITIGNKKLN